jgi:tyrosine-protein kinase Etk/Wzc
MQPDPMSDSAPLEESDEISLLDVALVLAENWKLLIFGPVAAGLAALGISFVIPPTFTAKTSIMTPQQQQSAAAMLASQLGNLGALGGAAGAIAGIKNPADTYVAMLKSRTVADALIEKFELQKLYEEDFQDDTRKTLEKRSRISAGKDGLINVEVDDHDPKRAAELANAYIAQLEQMMARIAVTEAGRRRLFFDKQLRQAKDDLTKAEIALRAGGVSEAVLKTAPQSALEPLARLKALVTATEVRVSAMRGSMTDSNPELRQAERELDALRSQLSRAQKSDTTSATGSGAEYIARYREFKYQEMLFELMAKQYEVARLDEAKEGALLQVVDPASPPERKSKPKKGLIALIATVATGVSLFLVLMIRQALQTTTSDPAAAGKLDRLRKALRFGRKHGRASSGVNS